MFAGNGDGTFTAPTITPVSNQGNAVSLLAGNLDHNGTTDVVICSDYPASAVVFFGNSTGQFTQEGSTSSLTTGLWSFSGATLPT
jgi:hypothetical protein